MSVDRCISTLRTGNPVGMRHSSLKKEACSCPQHDLRPTCILKHKSASLGNIYPRVGNVRRKGEEEFAVRTKQKTLLSPICVKQISFNSPRTRDARRPVSTDANCAARKGTAKAATVMERRSFPLRVWKNQPLYYTTSLSPSLSLAHSHRLSSRLAEMLPLLVVRTTAPPEVPLGETQLSAE